MSTLPYDHVSHSQLSTWAGRCQKQFELERVHRAPQIPAWWLIGGSCVHEVTEELDKRGLEFGLTPADLNVTLEIEELTEAKLSQLIRLEVESSGVQPDDWFAAGRSPQNLAYWREAAPRMVSNYLTWRTQKGWPVAFFGDEPAIEYDFNVTMKFGALKGAPDRVFVLPNGDLIVGDIKSGSSTPKEPLQLGLYATVIEHLGFRRPKYGTFIKVKDGVNTPLVPLARYDTTYLETLFSGFKKQLEVSLETGIFLPNVGDNCRTCAVQGACYAVGGAESALYDPLDPTYQPKPEGQQ